MKFVIDMMGGDNGSKVTVESVKKFSELHQDITFYCVGYENEMNELKGDSHFVLVPCQSVLAMDVNPMDAMHQNDASLNVAMKTYLDEKCDCLISAGSTGALVTEGVFKIKRLPGVKRPCLATPFPTIVKGKSFVAADLGANTENTPEELVVFAKLSSIYYSIIYGVESPKVHLLNNGTEEEKGNPLSKAAYQLMKEDKSINFCGNVEGRYPLDGNYDVVVTDGFTGNIFLKTIEGTAKAMSNLMKKAFTKNFSTKIGYLFAKGGFKDLKQTMDYKNVGGALLLGVNGVLIKAHGNSDVQSFTSTLKQGYKIVSEGMLEKIKERI